MANTSFKDYLKEKIKQKPNLEQEIEKAKKAIKIAHQIYDLRKARGYTQKELAGMIGISQSNIARIESADYNHYTITTLQKVANGLNADFNPFITDQALTAKLITAYNSHPTLQSFNQGSYFVSGLGTASVDNLIAVQNIVLEENFKVTTESEKIETKVSKYNFQYL